MQIDAARELFPELQNVTFLDAACVSLVPTSVTDAVRELLARMSPSHHRDATEYHIALDRTRERAVSEAAKLIGAAEADVALVESTSHALNIVVQGLDLGEGDRVVMPEIEFMGAAVPWVGAGVPVDLVPCDGGHVDVQRIIEACDERTRVVSVSSVEWTSGCRVDLRTLGAFTRDRGIWLVVDAIQQLGAHALDVGDCAVDALACGGHKWLNAPFGRGFLYVAPSLRRRLRPTCWSYLNLQTPEGGWGKYFKTPEISPVADYRFVDTAQGLELGGTTNYVGNLALGRALELINSLGSEAIEARIDDLSARLRESVRELGLTLVSPDDPAGRSGITTFSAGSPERNEELVGALLERRIQVSLRYTAGVGGIRVSTHFFNDRSDVDMLTAALRELLT